MKRFIPFLVLFVAGIAASFALASPPPGKGPAKTTSTSTVTSPGKSGKAKCRPINLKGTVAGGTIALKVTKASGPRGKHLLNTTVNLTVNGKVSVQAWDCSASGSASPQMKLRELHVGGSPQAPTTTTTTP